MPGARLREMFIGVGGVIAGAGCGVDSMIRHRLDRERVVRFMAVVHAARGQ